MDSKKTLIFAGVMFLLVGLIFVAVGIFVLKQDECLQQRCTEETIGTVVDIIVETHYDSEDGFEHTYYPVIEYKVGDRTITKKSNIGQGSSKYTVGQQIEICYNPNDVEEFIIKGDTSSDLMGKLFIALGSVAVAVAFFASFKKLADSPKSGNQPT